MEKPVLVLETHAALTGLATRMLRLQNVYAKPVPLTITPSQALALNPSAILWVAPLRGDTGLPMPQEGLLSAGIPLLALGDAAVALCLHLGGAVNQPLPQGQAITLTLESSPLFDQMKGGERLLSPLSSLDTPPSLLPMASATQHTIGFRHDTLPLYGLQYRLEHNDPDAAQLLLNFATHIGHAPPTWDQQAILDHALLEIRQAAGDMDILCAVSGGVDSAVCAKLAHLALPGKLHCLLVDTGLLRQGEAQQVQAAYREALGLEVECLDESATFLNAIGQVHTPEDKERLTITLLEQVLFKRLTQAGRPALLLTGTNFNDTLYGQTPPLARTGMEGHPHLMDPLRDLFKEEVRRLAQMLNLPAHITQRQAFPSSGLALRIVSQVTPEKLTLLRQADAIFQEEVQQGGQEKRLWQYFAMLLDMPEAPGRYCILLRALQAAHTSAGAARLPYDLLERTETRISQQLPQVARVVYDLTPSARYNQEE